MTESDTILDIPTIQEKSYLAGINSFLLFKKAVVLDVIKHLDERAYEEHSGVIIIDLTVKANRGNENLSDAERLKLINSDTTQEGLVELLQDMQDWDYLLSRNKLMREDIESAVTAMLKSFNSNTDVNLKFMFRDLNSNYQKGNPVIGIIIAEKV